MSTNLTIVYSGKRVVIKVNKNDVGNSVKIEVQEREREKGEKS